MTRYHSKLRLPNTPVSVQALLGRHLSKIPDENTPEQEFNLIRSLCPPKAFPAAFDVNSKIIPNFQPVRRTGFNKGEPLDRWKPGTWRLFVPIGAIVQPVA